MINHEFDIIRVLIASQDDEMIKKLILCLTENAYETVTVNNKTDARKNLLSFQPHILLVDRQIPTMNSLDLCREFHNACNIPILMLSNDDNIVDKVLSLEIGCDDFMTKDFDSRELIARIRAIVRRSHSNIPDFSTLSGTSPSADSDSSAKCITFPGLVINLTNYSVSYRGATIEMPPRELELLYFLAYRMGSRLQISDKTRKKRIIFTRLDDSSADDEAHHLTAYLQNYSGEVPHTAQSQRNLINSMNESVDSLECGNTGLHSQAKSLPGFQRSPFQTSDTHPHHTGHHYIRDVLLLSPNTAF